MKYRFYSFLVACCLLLPLYASDDCVFVKDGRSFPLMGRVQLVDSFEDLRVQIVDSFSDVDVCIVETTPARCGEVQLVSSFADVKVRLVDSFPDLRVRIVQSFPGSHLSSDGYFPCGSLVVEGQVGGDDVVVAVPFGLCTVAYLSDIPRLAIGDKPSR